MLSKILKECSKGCNLLVEDEEVTEQKEESD